MQVRAVQRAALQVCKRRPGGSWSCLHSSASPAVNVLGEDLPALQTLVSQGAGLPAFRAGQLFQELHRQNSCDFKEMQSLGKACVARLQAAGLTVDAGEVVAAQTSTDGTRKWLLSLPSTLAPAQKRTGGQVEMVWIPSAGSRTLCVSSQVGCTLSCSFCHTGTQPLLRNLAAADILAQVLQASRQLRVTAPDSVAALTSMHGVQGSALRRRPISNVVFMGQGEPLYNWRSVKRAIQVLTHPEGLGLSRRRVTVSTSGVAPRIPELASACGASLAVSLHSAVDDVRSHIMDVNRRWPLAELKDAIKQYISILKEGGRVARDARVTLEYTPLQGLNAGRADAAALVDFCRDIGLQWLHVNLIMFNAWEGAPVQGASVDAVRNFQRWLQQGGVRATVRQSRGDDIMAACGQLHSVANTTSATGVS